jgi:hypothetical protein
VRANPRRKNETYKKTINVRLERAKKSEKMQCTVLALYVPPIFPISPEPEKKDSRRSRVLVFDDLTEDDQRMKIRHLLGGRHTYLNVCYYSHQNLKLYPWQAGEFQIPPSLRSMPLGGGMMDSQRKELYGSSEPKIRHGYSDPIEVTHQDDFTERSFSPVPISGRRPTSSPTLPKEDHVTWAGGIFNNQAKVPFASATPIDAKPDIGALLDLLLPDKNVALYGRRTPIEHSKPYIHFLRSERNTEVTEQVLGRAIRRHSHFEMISSEDLEDCPDLDPGDGKMREVD